MAPASELGLTREATKRGEARGRVGREHVPQLSLSRLLRSVRGGSRGEQVFGPAFLVYYSPAFLRTLAPTAALPALRILAEVYRRARELWPLRPTTGNTHSVTVRIGGRTTRPRAATPAPTSTPAPVPAPAPRSLALPPIPAPAPRHPAPRHLQVRIDQLKELKLSSILDVTKEGASWLLVRKNEHEGVVERHGIDAIADLGSQQIQTAVLKLWRLDKQQGRDASSNSQGSFNSGGSTTYSGRSGKRGKFRWGSTASSGTGSIGGTSHVSIVEMGAVANPACMGS